jgi:hypothetical protein
MFWFIKTLRNTVYFFLRKNEKQVRAPFAPGFVDPVYAHKIEGFQISQTLTNTPMKNKQGFEVGDFNIVLRNLRIRQNKIGIFCNI